MADDSSYSNLIPLIWQFNAHTSPGVTERASTYGVGGIPDARWGGVHQVVGGGVATINTYIQRYNQVVALESSIEIDINMSFDISGQNVNITADVVGSETIPTDDTRVIFIMTYNRDTIQPGDYFASVVRHFTQAFVPETTRYTHSFALDSSWEHARANVVVIIQNTGTGPKTIHNAMMRPLMTIEKITNFHTFSSPNRVHLVWQPNRVDREILGYNVYKDESKLNFNIITSTSFTDFSVSAGDTPSYAVSIVFLDGEESEWSDLIEVPIETNVNQLGSGERVHGNRTAGPVNVFNQSMRGQFIFTADELRAAGITRAGYIRGLGFFIVNAPSLTLPNFMIKMKSTNLDSPIAHDDGPFSVSEYVGNYQPSAGNWRMVDFESPLYWNGESNILIDTSFGIASNFSATGQIRTIFAHRGYRFVTHSTQNVQNSVTTLLQSNKPQVRLVYDAVSPSLTHPIQNLTGVFEEGAINLSWQNPADMTNFQGFRVYRDGLVMTNDLWEDQHFADANIIADQDYTYIVTAIYRDGESATVTLSINASVSDSDTIIQPNIRLIGNYPNPFNPTTTISFQVAGSDEHGLNSSVQIEIFNIRGQKVRNLVNDEFISGIHTVVWDGVDDLGGSVSSGVYLYRLTTAEHQDTKKMILMK
jgi:hypothetical protein